MDYEIKIIKKETSDPFSNGLIVERDREKRDLEWQAVEELIAAAKKTYLDGKVPMENILAQTIEVLYNEREKRLEFERNYDPSEELIKKDLEERHTEEISKAEQQGT